MKYSYQMTEILDITKMLYSTNNIHDILTQKIPQKDYNKATKNCL